MILDKGICSVYKVDNIAIPGDMPKDGLVLKYQSWYGELNYETVPVEAAGQEGIEISARIRVLQNRVITNHDVVILPDNPEQQYDIIRAYHGVDDESGEPISDLTLRKLVTAYDLATT